MPAQTGTGASVPALDAQTLDGTALHLPDSHQPALLILGFSRKAGDGVTAWSKVLSHTAWNTHAATVYEVAFLGSVPRPLRGLVTRSMRKQVPAAAQSHFLIVDSDPQVWKSLVSISHEDDPCLLLLDPAGVPRWHTCGPYTEAGAAEASRQVAGVRSR